MKKIFIFAAVALVALCNISCSSDEEPLPTSGNVQLAPPAASSTAAAYDIPDVTSTTGQTLDAVNFTESGKAVLTIGTASGAKCMTFDSAPQKLDDNKTKYTLKDGTKDAGYIIATVKKAANAARRASGETIELEIHLTVDVPEVGSVTFDDTTDNADQLPPAAETTALNNICRTWYVELIDVTLSGDVDCTLTEYSGNLLPIAQKAQDNDAQLKYDEFKELCRSVNSIILDKTGLFSIEYQNASGTVQYYKTKADKDNKIFEPIQCDGKKSSEVCSWEWIDSTQKSFRLKFRKSDFGNKFLNEDSRISVDFNEKISYFSISTKITGNKNYTAKVVFQLHY